MITFTFKYFLFQVFIYNKLITVRLQSCGKAVLFSCVCFSVIASVCMFSGVEGVHHTWICSNLFTSGTIPRPCTTHTRPPSTQPVQIFSFWKAGSWPSTERPSCQLQFFSVCLRLSLFSDHESPDKELNTTFTWRTDFFSFVYLLRSRCLCFNKQSLVHQNVWFTFCHVTFNNTCTNM